MTAAAAKVRLVVDTSTMDRQLAEAKTAGTRLKVVIALGHLDTARSRYLAASSAFAAGLPVDGIARVLKANRDVQTAYETLGGHGDVFDGPRP